MQECGAGLIRVRRDGGRLAFAAPPLVRGGPVSADERAELGRILRIDPADLVAAQWLDNGPGWIGVLLADAATVLAVQPDLSACEWLSSVGIVGAHPENSDVAFELRTFMRDGREDPVTGSFNASVGQWLIDTGVAPASYVASQGTCLGRRGRIHVDAIDGDVWVGGNTVLGICGSVAI